MVTPLLLNPKLLLLISKLFLPDENYVTHFSWIYLDYQECQYHNQEILVLFSLPVPLFLLPLLIFNPTVLFHHFPPIVFLTLVLNFLSVSKEKGHNKNYF